MESITFQLTFVLGESFEAPKAAPKLPVTVIGYFEKPQSMNRYLIFLTLYLSTYFLACSLKKDFEGVIIYSQILKSKTNELSNEELLNYYGDTVIVTIKKGNYHQRYLNAKGITDMIYLSSQNRAYFKLHGIDTLYYHDCGIEASKIIGIVKNKGLKSIMGYPCKSITIKSTSMTSTYFFSEALYKNPTFFSKYKHTHYNAYIEQANAIYLKLVFDYKIFRGEFNAVDISIKEINDNIFNLPDLPTVER